MIGFLFLLHVDMRLLIATTNHTSSIPRRPQRDPQRELHSLARNVDHSITEKKSKFRFRNWKWKINFVEVIAIEEWAIENCFWRTRTLIVTVSLSFVRFESVCWANIVSYKAWASCKTREENAHSITSLTHKKTSFSISFSAISLLGKEILHLLDF